MTTCKQCGKKFKKFFCNGYEEYCYKCGMLEAYKDYDSFLEEQFEAELQREDPDFTDLYEIGERFI